MSWRTFETQVSGKWVLAGEHSVLRGQMAVALPHPELGLEICFEPSGGPLSVDPAEALPLIEEMLGALPGLAGQLPSGRLRIASTLPVGAGLGSSAALSIALTRWLAEPLRVPQSEWLDFATRLENRFHGKSSGMDVAAILAGGPIRFFKGQPAQPIRVSRLPRFTFHDTGKRASTSQCVAKVQDFTQVQPTDARRIDEWMGQAARLAALGLEKYGAGDTGPGLDSLAEAMRLSSRCFEAWGLMPPEAMQIHQQLLAQGALAAKLTGAGGGGFVVALWGDQG
jgi:mevalonate kinase